MSFICDSTLVNMDIGLDDYSGLLHTCKQRQVENPLVISLVYWLYLFIDSKTSLTRLMFNDQLFIVLIFLVLLYTSCLKSYLCSKIIPFRSWFKFLDQRLYRTAFFALRIILVYFWKLRSFEINQQTKHKYDYGAQISRIWLVTITLLRKLLLH